MEQTLLLLLHTAQTKIVDRVIGIPQTMMFTNSDILFVLLVLCFAFCFWILLRYGRGIISMSFTDFFSVRKRANLFSETNFKSVQLFMVLFSLNTSIFMYYVINDDKELVSSIHFLLTVFAFLLLILSFCILKEMLLKALASVFSQKEKILWWHQILYSNLFVLTFISTPLLFCLLYSVPNYTVIVSSFFAFFVFFWIICMYKVVTIFVDDFESLFYFILYLCGVEIIPIALMYRIMTSIFKISMS